MRRTLVFAVLAFVLLTVNIWAEEPPGIMLEKGRNEIPVSVVNRLKRDITSLTIKVEQQNIPEWLTLEGTIRSIDVEQGEKVTEQLFIIMFVMDAPENAEALVPFALKDKSGKKWTFSARVFVNTGKHVYDALFENYPNPFNPSTTIRYSLSESRHTTVTVYNALGQKIRTLADGPQTAGVHTVQWDGRNEFGQRVSSGMYLYQLRSGDYIKTMKMVLFE